jgi:hypothetical protein
MRRDNRKRAERLRLMVDCLPYETRVAMLEGLGRYEIIAGAYSARGGGVCPMLAAHRCGGRTDFRGFARAWDRFTGARKRARRASQRELRTLVSQLEASIWNEGQVLELRRQADRLARQGRGQDQPEGAPSGRHEGAATAPHQVASRVRSPQRPALPPARRRAAWLVPFRSFEDYRLALDAALREIDEGRPQGAPEPARSAGRIIMTSGMTHTGESRSRQRTTSATS